MSDDFLKQKEDLNEATGMPVMKEEEIEKAKGPKGKVFLVFFPLIFVGVGTGIAFTIYKKGDTEKYDERITLVNSFDLQWGYLSAFLFSYLVAILNLYPMGYKNRIMRNSSGNLRANMFIYKSAAENSSESRVVLATEGDEGHYNRANRSLYHFAENSIQLALTIGLSSFVFPFPTFILTAILFVGRLIYTVGYTTGGYGGHVPGFILVMIAVNTLYGMLLITVFKGMNGAVNVSDTPQTEG